MTLHTTMNNLLKHRDITSFEKDQLAPMIAILDEARLTKPFYFNRAVTIMIGPEHANLLRTLRHGYPESHSIYAMNLFCVCIPDTYAEISSLHKH